MSEYLVIEADKTAFTRDGKRVPVELIKNADSAQQAAFMFASMHVDLIGHRAIEVHVSDQSKPVDTLAEVFLIEPRTWYAVRPKGQSGESP